MRYPYPTSIDFSNGTDSLFVWLNTVTFGWFSNFLLIAIWFIFATGFYMARRDVQGALAVAGTMTFLVSLPLYIGGMVSGIAFTIVIGIAIVGFASLFVGHPD
jgi:hypothetical protein